MSFQGIEYVNHPNAKEREAYYAYVCGHCGHKVNGFVVATYFHQSWLLCTECGCGSVINDYQIFPSPLFGPEMQGLPDEVKKAYNELRNCMSVNAFTASELLCRKILMHISVEKGAEDGKTFEFYIDYLVQRGYVTPVMKDWVDLIRKHGNEATHLLESPDQQRAESTATFTVQLLRIVYEMKHIADKFPPKKKEGK